MNEDAAVQAIKTVIGNAASTLLTDLSYAGVPRKIQHLASTELAVPGAYFAIAVKCPRSRERSMPAGNNLTGKNWVEYDMVVQVADVAQIDPNEEVAYETAHSDFRKFRDRIVRLVRDTTEWFPSAASTPRFRLPVSPGQEHKAVDVENQAWHAQDQQRVGYAMLFSRITFKLIDHCADSSLLY